MVRPGRTKQGVHQRLTFDQARRSAKELENADREMIRGLGAPKCHETVVRAKHNRALFKQTNKPEEKEERGRGDIHPPPFLGALRSDIPSEIVRVVNPTPDLDYSYRRSVIRSLRKRVEELENTNRDVVSLPVSTPLANGRKGRGKKGKKRVNATVKDFYTSLEAAGWEDEAEMLSLSAMRIDERQAPMELNDDLYTFVVPQKGRVARAARKRGRKGRMQQMDDVIYEVYDEESIPSVGGGKKKGKGRKKRTIYVEVGNVE